MSVSAFPVITPGFSFRPTSPYVAALAAAVQRRLDSPLTPPGIEVRPLKPLTLGEAAAGLVLHPEPEPDEAA